MTLIVSITHPEAIIMASDSYLTKHMRSETGTGEHLEDRFEIATISKTYEIPGMGCLSFWGTWRVDPKPSLEEFIRRARKEEWDIEQASFGLLQYLKEKLQPNEQLGFHLGGFSSDNVRKLYHVFYGRQVYDPPLMHYNYYRNEEDIGEPPDRYRLLYNGEPRVATEAIEFLRRFQRDLTIPVMSPGLPIEKIVAFAVFLINYTHDQMMRAGGIPSVGGRINIAIIRPGNIVEWQTRPPK